MPKFTVYAKRSTIQKYEVEAESEADAEKKARAYLEKQYYLSDGYYDENDDEQESPFEQIGYGDDSQEEFESAEAA